MTTLTGDKCSACGYAFEVFDRACPRCNAANSGIIHRRASTSGWLPEQTVRFLGYLAFWASLSAAVATVSCACVLRALANL